MYTTQYSNAKEFHKIKLQILQTKNFILTMIHTWHQHLLHHDTKACIPPQKMVVSSPCSQEVSLLHDGDCCKSLASQVLLKRSEQKEIKGCEIRTVWQRTCKSYYKNQSQATSVESGLAFSWKMMKTWCRNLVCHNLSRVPQ